MTPKLFLGPGTHLLYSPYGQHRVPWGHWYRVRPFEIIRQASYLEIYIFSNYSLHKPIDTEQRK